MIRKEQWLEGWSNRSERSPVDVETTVIRSDGRQLAIRLANISHEGCQILCGETLPIGEVMTLSLPDSGEVRAQVRWSLAGRAGVYFCDSEEGRLSA